MTTLNSAGRSKSSKCCELLALSSGVGDMLCLRLTWFCSSNGSDPVLSTMIGPSSIIGEPGGGSSTTFRFMVVVTRKENMNEVWVLYVRNVPSKVHYYGQ